VGKGAALCSMKGSDADNLAECCHVPDRQIGSWHSFEHLPAKSLVRPALDNAGSPREVAFRLGIVEPKIACGMTLRLAGPGV